MTSEEAGSPRDRGAPGGVARDRAAGDGAAGDPLVGPRTCAQCGQPHRELEPAFRRPDALLAVPPAERADRVRQSDDLCSIDDTAFFIRCVAPIPVAGRAAPFHWGFWVQVSRPDFEGYFSHFDADPPLDHPGFPGTISNQTSLLPPTLGLPVHVVMGRGSARPRLMLLDGAHPLTRDQERGVTETQVAAWVARLPCGPGDECLEPPVPPFQADLGTHGWSLSTPESLAAADAAAANEMMAGPVVSPPLAPRPGDRVQVVLTYRAAGPHGDVALRTARAWVRLEEVRPDGRWGGTLDEALPVPGPVGRGSRVWLRGEHAIGFEPDPGASGGQGPGGGEADPGSEWPARDPAAAGPPWPTAASGWIERLKRFWRGR
jgi:hypothetical protein